MQLSQRKTEFHKFQPFRWVKRLIFALSIALLLPIGFGLCGFNHKTCQSFASPSVAQSAIKHKPRLQLGNAPLVGFPGSNSDRVDILWQTLPAGIGTEDSFVVEYRPANGIYWLAATIPKQIDTGIENRLNYHVTIDGLRFNTVYDYRVRHLRGDEIVETYQDTFRTRLAVSDETPFIFAAYGDSADAGNGKNFRSVQNRINLSDAEFALLLGDNAYPNGTHQQFDERFDPTLNPEATTWTASHIDYVSFGNHDIATDRGKPTEDNYSVPIPAAGVTSPVELPSPEPGERNYSFDYGIVHFATFDSNSWGVFGDRDRLEAQLNWLEQDLAASSAPWKIVFAHHPVAGVPDKLATPSDYYYQQVVPRLRSAGVDLFLVGHSHTYGWTYPLLGERNGAVSYVLDTDKHYAKGTGLIQVVSGAGGKSLRSGSFNRFRFVASGFSTNTTPELEYGFAQISVMPNQLTVDYIAADDGAVLDSFQIIDTENGEGFARSG